MRPALANIITARVPEADLLIDTMTVRPQGNRAFLISDTIRRLKAADIWAKLDVLWMLAAHDAQAARLNWKAPASFALTAVNSPTFTVDRGYAGNATTSYLNTGWDASTNGVNYTQNSCSGFAWSLTSRGQSLFSLMGSYNGSTLTAQIYPRYQTEAYVRLNDLSGGVANTDSTGLFLGARTASNAWRVDRNGSSLGTGIDASSARHAIDVYLLGTNNNNSSLLAASSDQCFCAGIGGAITSAESIALYDILNAYKNAVGAA